MHSNRFTLIITVVLFTMACVLLWLLMSVAYAAQSNSLTVCPAGPPDCNYAIIQDAVDAASDGDVIKIATGIYTDVHARPRRDITTTGVVTQVVYISKTVTIRGGYTAPDFLEPPNPEVNLTTLDAQGQGRVLYITGQISPTIEGLRVTRGDADGLGGGGWGSDAGGGVYVITAALTLRATQVYSNTAEGGGGLYLYQCNYATLSDNVIAENSLRHGSGNPPWAMGGGLFVLLCDNTVLRGNTIVSNTAHVEGGGIYLYAHNATIDRNSIRANSSESCGGLIIYSQGGVLNGNSICGNVAEQGSGGGLCLTNDITMTNNLIADNQASTSGCGLFITGSCRHLLHNTIARNTGGDGSGIYVTRWGTIPHTVTLSNTILVSHTIGISVTAGNTVTLEATLWGTDTWANEVDWGGPGTIITGTRNLWDEPDFLAPETGDYHIGAASAAIDKGVNAGVSTDIDGQLRPDGCFFDIGADERMTGGSCFRVYLPLIVKNR